ncbi:TetR/AcrR family transcriptional regulator [Rhizobium jaguaris]|uniref:TetR/AcrR family transcriptional regulator n=1 Tax=Rhizobium jaguaris TaxID=1312183 RepID=A0A387FTE1_9HYPH|nr:TetR/AcrR family transcriptional regulator [Rhizobium jaguaris]AYG60675.1 TetR/AcrR family transcriptional regulator [Rhizobium jaguaris]
MARPRQFDEDRVLDAAGEIFWAKGYEATSTRDLTDRMALTHASLYNAFGDKRGLYLKALQRYLDRNLRSRIARMEATYSPGLTIVGYFEEIVERSLADAEHRGCLLVNTALEARSDDPEMQRAVADETAEIEAFFLRTVTAAQASGEIPANQPPEDIAKLLLSVQFGLRVLVRVRPERELLNGILRPAMAMLTLPWPLPESRPDG